ncbi:MAG: hypothetical protein J1E57_05780 [Prevotella sp.]|nr:hypothetical protein [Prevotella sp.]
MKRKYVNPEITVIRIESDMLLATSLETKSRKRIDDIDDDIFDGISGD